jgi:hypothetical protein
MKKALHLLLLIQQTEGEPQGCSGRLPVLEGKYNVDNDSHDAE